MLENLINSLDNIKYAYEALSILENLDLLSFFVKNSYLNTGYTRTLLYTNTKYDIYLIEWAKMSETEYHDHSEGGCAMKVLVGNLFEQKISKKYGKINSFLPTNSVSYIDNDIGYHKIKEITNNPAISIHVYFPSSYTTNYYKNL